MQRTTVVCRCRALVVGEERFAGMTEDDRLLVVERVDRRVHAMTMPGPRAEQELEWLDVRMQWGSHVTIVRSGASGYRGGLTEPVSGA